MRVLVIGDLHSKRPKNIAMSSFFGNFMCKKPAKTEVSIQALICMYYLCSEQAKLTFVGKSKNPVQIGKSKIYYEEPNGSSMLTNIK